MRVKNAYYNEKGEIAVLISPGFGTGWSCSNELEFATDKRIVELVIKYNGAQNVPREELFDVCLKIVEENWGFDVAKDYTLNLYGWNDVVIKWVSCGTYFRVREYDGYESVETLNLDMWNRA